MKPKILLITGPQGSGNHVFSKCFALHKEVSGWNELLDRYWIRHEFEPYGNIWRKPEFIKDLDWSLSQYHVISISCPYVDEGITVVPDYKSVIPELQKVGDIILGLIGREEFTYYRFGFSKPIFFTNQICFWLHCNFVKFRLPIKHDYKEKY